MRARTVFGLTAFYLLFIGGFSLAFGEWWPVLAFAWLVCGKLAQVVFERRDLAGERHRQQSTWAISCGAYLVGVFATTLLPLPRFGLTRDVRPLLELPGEGLWIEEPHRVVIFGAAYFSLLAWVKYTDFVLPASNLPGLDGKR